MRRTYLVPVKSSRGYVGVAVATGLLVSAGITLAAAAGVKPPIGLDLLGCALLALGPFLLLAVILARAVPGHRMHIAAQLAGLATAIALVYARVMLKADDGGASIRLEVVGAMAVLTMAFTLAGTLIATAVLLGVRAVFGRPVPDDERLCAGCGYEYGTATVICPECGAARERRVHSARWSVGAASVLQRRWRAVAIICAMVVGLDLGSHVVNATIPATRARLSMPGWTPVSPWPDLDLLRLHGPLDAAVSLWEPEHGGNGTRGLVVSSRILGRDVRDMLVRVAMTPTRNDCWSGSVRVQARLSERQAVSVLRHGLPPELARALLREADRRGWSASPPSIPEPTYTIDAGSFFSSGD